jgi:uncharacterized protein (DUF2235 family)
MTEVERFRTERIEFRATVDEKRQLKKNMRQAGYGTLGNYLLQMGLNGFIVQVDFSDIKATLGDVGSLRIALNQIGNNINQVARHVNESQEIDAMDFYLLQQEFEGMKQEIQNFEKEVVQTFNQKLKNLGVD